jgi:DNA sulfur modification protein DndD
MIIKKVVINNFYCFLDENIFEFSKGLNIISAENSGGKSQLFNAFYWTFFDKVYADKDGNSTKKEWKSSSNINVCPDKIKEHSEDGERIECSVEINLMNEFHENEENEDDLVEYNFLKKVVYEKSSKNLSTYLKPELSISYVRNGETEFIPSQSQSWFMETIFPVSIRKFMWYQGETMDDLYDFSNPTTLKNAINEISYFPMYDNMEKIVKKSSVSIAGKVEKELKKQNKLTEHQEKILADITYTNKQIEAKNEKARTLEIDVEKLEDDISNEEHKLRGYDKYTAIKRDLIRLENDAELTKLRINDAINYQKEKLINKWMLYGCIHLIEASKKNLELINDEIKTYQETNNPVPISLPGPEYVEKMLEDKICYICEREVLDETPAYNALKKRLDDFTDNSKYKILQDNYTDLNKAKRRLISDLPDIHNEIREKDNELKSLEKKRYNLDREKDKIFEDSGHDSKVGISDGANNASQILSKIKTLTSNKDRKTEVLKQLKREINEKKSFLNEIESRNKEILDNKNTNSIIEVQASHYINMFVDSIGELKNIAYAKLISQIQVESNRLYSLYLGGKTAGEIEISNNGIRIIDKATKTMLHELNTAEIVAQKLAVANAFLSLSEKKMRKSYPIVADAPTSDLDHENTYNLTKNIGKSFDQMIIMSKDYTMLSEEKRNELIHEAKIVKFYELKNKMIDMNGLDSRTNKKAFITSIK